MTDAQSYVICATPRSGSTLLCDMLTDTGIAGSPDSFFRRESFLDWADYFGVPVAGWRGEHEFDRAYLSAVKRYGSNGTGVFGMRLMWESVRDLSDRLGDFYPGLSSDSERLGAAFGPPRYLHLSRKDKVAQAISLLRAEQSGLWHVFADGSERERLTPAREAVYDFERLSMLVARLEQHDAAWVQWFAGQRMEPLRITYEALSKDPRSVLATVLAALDLEPAAAEAAGIRTAKLADGESREWAARFRRESGVSRFRECNP